MKSFKTQHFKNSHKYKFKPSCAGAVLVESALIFSFFTLMCFGGLNIITGILETLSLQDTIRSSALAVSELPLEIVDGSGTTCDAATSVIRENIIISGHDPEAYDIRVCPFSLGESPDGANPGTAALSLRINSHHRGGFVDYLVPKVETNVILEEAIIKKEQVINCPEVVTSCA